MQALVARTSAGAEVASELLRRYPRSYAEELGIDPSPVLRELEAKILRQDPSLVLETEPRVETLGV